MRRGYTAVRFLGSRATNTRCEPAGQKSVKVSGTLGGRKEFFVRRSSEYERWPLVVNEEEELVL